jgi:hypothetical protein
MGTPAFGLMPGNNATPPPFFAGNNPTGGTRGTGGSGGLNNNFPNFPLFGNPNTSGVASPTANAPLFGGSSMTGLSTGFGTSTGALGGNELREFQRAYGKGTGDLLYQMMSKGLFNPNTASAFLNAMQPGINRGQENLLNSFGAEGSRFSSTAAFGLGDYFSQVNLNEQQTLASMYMQAQQEQLGLLENTLPTLHNEQANQGSWLDDLMGGLEIGASILGAPFTGGLSLGGIAGGLSTIMGHGGGSGGGNASPSLSGIATPQMSSGTPSFFPSGTQSAPQDFWQQYFRGNLSASGGDSLFGSN